MAQTSRFSAAFCRLVIVGLLAGCGPLVAERDDDFIEEQCELSCDRFDECGLGFGDCMDVCAELVTWCSGSRFGVEFVSRYFRDLRGGACEVWS